MQIIIRDLNEPEVVLTNNHLDNYNYVELVIGNSETTVPLDELLSAVMAFQTYRNFYGSKKES
jgi:hypothetical protein